MAIKPEDFSDVDLSGLPGLDSLQDDRERCLWLLWVAADRIGVQVMTPAQMSDVFRDTYAIAIPRQRIQAILAAEKGGTVARRKVNGRLAYQIMRAGIDEVTRASADVVFIEPAKSLKSIRQVESLLGGRAGLLRFCDPYVNGKTLDFLAECAQATELRLLTGDIQKPGPFARDLKAFRREHSVPIEVRSIGNGTLHDRYVIDDKNLLLFGASLNNLGAKQSFVVTLGPDMRQSVLATYEQMWTGASVV